MTEGVVWYVPAYTKCSFVECMLQTNTSPAACLVMRLVTRMNSPRVVYQLSAQQDRER